MSYRVKCCENRKDRRDFIDLARRIRVQGAAYVPPLTREALKRIDAAKNPWFAHGSARFWMAFDGDRPVGRISAAVDQLANDWTGEAIGVFGHFLAEDEAAARLLVETARTFLREQGLERMRGPIELSTNYSCGLQVSGFDFAPMIDMNQHREGTEKLLLAQGLEGVKDLLAFRVSAAELELERLERVCALAEKRFPAKLRRIDVAHFSEEIAKLHSIYERAWEKNFGFVPMSRAEFDAAAKDFKTILDPEICVVAELEGEAIGFLVALPDANVGIRACDGRLFPFGFLKLLKALKRTTHMRVITLGIVPEARGRGLDARLILECIRRGQKRGYDLAELSWVLEDNVAMVKPLLTLGAKEAQRYRLYECGL